MDPTPSRSRTCPRCGVPLPLDALEGLCPACLLTAATETVSQATGDRLTMTSMSGDGPIAASRLSVGQVFGPYRIERLLGRGGMGEVYEAEHVEDGRQVALKVLRERLGSPSDRARFLREGQLAASVNHPNSVYIFDSDEIDGVPVISMELLPGGTLKRRVDRHGPMPPADAVDAMLQVIAGLAAAEAAGVLHRDIKPSNCFLSADAHVKVGDFGLSVSTLAREVTSTAFHGTPEFAPPEQLKGQPLDVRSDIYAVGATMYFLLTGKPPFEERDVPRLIERVETDTPPSPRTLQPNIPSGLATIVLQCLARDPAKRPRSYAELTEALRPFASPAPIPASLGIRFAAELIDTTVLLIITLPQLAYILKSLELLSRDKSVDTLFRVAAFTPTFPTWLTIVGWFLPFGYYGVLEGVWGSSIGKRVCDLRVINAAGQPPGVPRAIGRHLTLCGPQQLVMGLRLLFDASRVSNFLAAHVVLQLLESNLMWVWPFVTFISARRHNGYAAFHDLATGTRVVYAPSVTVSTLPATSSATPILRPWTLDRLGPFDIMGAIATTNEGDVLLGFDERLKRHVWIRTSPAGTPPLPRARRDMDRGGRLRWITGQRTEALAWDAYEAPDGAPLLVIYALPQPWRIVKHWLVELAREMEDAQAERAMPPLDLGRVWITSSGHAKLLEFDISGLPANTNAPPQDFLESAGVFLAVVARCATQGRSDAARLSDPTKGRWSSAVPVRARAVLESLTNPLARSARVAASILESISSSPDTIVRWRRALPAALVGVPLVLVLGLVSIGASLAKVTAAQGLDEMMVCLQLLRESSSVTHERMVTRRVDDDLLEVYLAGKFGTALRNPRMWTQNLTVRRLAPTVRRVLEDHPTVSPEEFKRAAAIVQPSITPQLVARHNTQWLDRFGLAGALGVIAMNMLMQMAVVGLILAVAKPGGIVLGLAGMGIVNRRGEETSRWRALWRAIVTWSPALASPIFDRAAMQLGPAHPLFVPLLWMPVALMAYGAIFAIIFPERGLADRLAGTALVPQ